MRAVLLTVILVGCSSTPLAPPEPLYLMVDELAARDPAELAIRPLKVHGFVEAGSIRLHVVAQETVRTFVLQKSGKRLRVFATGPVPESFRDQAELVATGRLVASGELTVRAKQLGVVVEEAYALDATELAAKCPSRYGDNPKGAPPGFR